MGYGRNDLWSVEPVFSHWRCKVLSGLLLEGCLRYLIFTISNYADAVAALLERNSTPKGVPKGYQRVRRCG